jgi:hypothetical protein
VSTHHKIPLYVTSSIPHLVQKSQITIFRLSIWSLEVLIAVKMLVITHKTIEHHNSDDNNRQFHCHGNFQSQTAPLPASCNCTSAVTHSHSTWWYMHVSTSCQQVTDLEHLQKQCQHTDVWNWCTYKSVLKLSHSYIYFLTKRKICT